MCEESFYSFLVMGINAQVISIAVFNGQGILFLMTSYWSLFIMEMIVYLSALGFFPFFLGETSA